MPHSYAASLTDEICVVLHTNDNNRTVATLRRYLILGEEDGEA